MNEDFVSPTMNKKTITIDTYTESTQALTVERKGDRIQLRLGDAAYVNLTEDQAVRVVSRMLTAIRASA